MTDEVTVSMGLSTTTNKVITLTEPVELRNALT